MVSKQDCFHYCIPGPIDQWVIFVYNLLFYDLKYSTNSEENDLLDTIVEEKINEPSFVLDDIYEKEINQETDQTSIFDLLSFSELNKLSIDNSRSVKVGFKNKLSLSNLETSTVSAPFSPKFQVQEVIDCLTGNGVWEFNHTKTFYHHSIRLEQNNPKFCFHASDIYKYPVLSLPYLNSSI